jgi:SWI/SNF-related matrix-associated actin-dependent regulator 1 of chromatin subfamily A
VIADGLAEFGAVMVTGEVSSRDRQTRIDRFQRDDGTRVFVGNILAAGTGATLTAGCEVVFVEMSFTPGHNSQAADRTHRMGQSESVRVRCIALASTVDEDLTNALRRKTRLQREVLR